MSETVAIIAPGAMGAAVAARLAEHGVAVRTSLARRSAASAKRAAAARMIACEDDRAMLDGAAAILSIVPPGEALALARRLAPTLASLDRKPAWLELNAVNPATVERIVATLTPAGVRFIGGGIIGGPPKPGTPGPRFYLAGPEAGGILWLKEKGLDLRLLPGPVTAASALKMSYAGITKGLTAIGSAMILGAAAGGSAEALLAELGESQPQLLAYLRRSVPDMYAKAYRWVAEMREIAAFLPGETGADAIYEGAARLYEHLAADNASAEERRAIAALDAFFSER